MAEKEKINWDEVEDDEDFAPKKESPQTEGVHQSKNETYDNQNSKVRPNANKKVAVPWPSRGPYRAYVGGLPFKATEKDLLEFLEDHFKVAVLSTQFVYDNQLNKAKGFGYVVFETLDGLKRIVSLSDEQNGIRFMDRTLRFDVAESKAGNNKPRNNNNDYNDNRGGRNFKSNRGRRNNNNNYSNNRSDMRNDSSNNDSSGPSTPVSTQRTKLELAPRSSNTSTVESSPKAASKANPFGEAQPRDENAILKRKEEERLAREQTETKEGTESPSTDQQEAANNKNNNNNDENATKTATSEQETADNASSSEKKVNRLPPGVANKANSNSDSKPKKKGKAKPAKSFFKDQVADKINKSSTNSNYKSSYQQQKEQEQQQKQQKDTPQQEQASPQETAIQEKEQPVVPKKEKAPKQKKVTRVGVNIFEALGENQDE